jgi:TrmH family RNA methyltransferase
METETYRESVVVALCEPRSLVNVAGAVRAMMNMGLRRLRLVNPAEYDAYRIEGIAHGGEVVLERVEFHATLEAAVADAGLVAGTTARRRTAKQVWDHPRAAAAQLLADATPAAPLVVVFGREDTGLTNEELDLCDRVLTVPTDPERWSLNLAQAVLLVTYELWMAAGAAEAERPRERRATLPATSAELRELFEGLETALDSIDFFKAHNPPAIMRTLRAVFRRAGLDQREARLLKAIAFEIRKRVERP